MGSQYVLYNTQLHFPAPAFTCSLGTYSVPEEPVFLFCFPLSRFSRCPIVVCFEQICHGGALAGPIAYKGSGRGRILSPHERRKAGSRGVGVATRVVSQVNQAIRDKDKVGNGGRGGLAPSPDIVHSDPSQIQKLFPAPTPSISGPVRRLKVSGLVP